jgi:hypothetical protein
MTHNHSSPCLHDRQYGAPDEVVLCKCGKAEPLFGHDDCFACEVAWAMANPDEHDDCVARGYGDTPASKRVVDAVASERVRRFGEQVPVYRRTA